MGRARCTARPQAPGGPFDPCLEALLLESGGARPEQSHARAAAPAAAATRASAVEQASGADLDFLVLICGGAQQRHVGATTEWLPQLVAGPSEVGILRSETHADQSCCQVADSAPRR